MKKTCIFLCLQLFALASWAQPATPGAGDVIFTYVNANNDGFELLTLKRLDLSTLKFTDNGICSNDLFRTGETMSIPTNVNAWTDVPAGTFIRIALDGTGTNDNDAYKGGLWYSNNLSILAANGDNLIAYTGVAQGGPNCSGTGTNNYVSGVIWGTESGFNSGATSSSESKAPGTPTDFYAGSHSTRYYNGSIAGAVSALIDNTGNGLRDISAWTGTNNGSAFNGTSLTLKDIKFDEPNYLSGVISFSSVSSSGFTVDVSGLVFSNSSPNITRYMVVVQSASLSQPPADRFTCYQPSLISGDYNNTLPTAINVTGQTATDFCGTPTYGSGKIVHFDYTLPSQIVVTGLSANNVYYVRVYAVNGNGYTANFSSVPASASWFIPAGSAPQLYADNTFSLGNVCVNIPGVSSFPLYGANLDGSDIIVGPTTGVAFSLDENGNFDSTINLSAYGSTINEQSIFVKFQPGLEQVYNLQIPVAGGAASVINITATATGVNTSPTVMTGGVLSVGTTIATLSGVISDTGCTSPSAFGVEYSIANNFPPGTAVSVPSNNLNPSNEFSVVLSSLTDSTKYYYRTYAVNNGGISYSALHTFTTRAIAAPIAITPDSISESGFLARWNPVPDATGYRLDISNSSTFVDTNYTELVAWHFPNNPDDAIADGGIGINATKELANNATGGISYVSVSGSETSAATVSGWTNGADTRYWEIELATTGYYELHLFSVQRSSNTGPRDFKVQYKIGAGGTYTDVPGGSVTVMNDWTTGIVSNLSLPTACDNQPSVFVRWIMSSDTSANGGLVQTLGTSAIDRIVVEGKYGLFLPGYYDLSVSDTMQQLNGLSPNTTYYYRVRATGVNSTSINSNVVSVLTHHDPFTTIYRSVKSGDFSDVSTWEININGSSYVPASQIPGIANKVWIQEGDTVSVDNSQALTLATLQISSSAMFTLGTNAAVHLKGDVFNNGMVNGDGTLVLNGVGTQTISGDGYVHNLELNNSQGATIATQGSLNLTGTLSLTSGTLYTNDKLILKSSVGSTASVGPVTGSIIGAVTHEKYFDLSANASGGRTWRLITSPIANNSVSNSVFYHWQNDGSINNGGLEIFGPTGTGSSGNGVSQGGAATSLRTFNAASNAWVPVTNTKTQPLCSGSRNNAFLAFFCGPYGSGNISSGASPTCIRAHGTLVTGIQTYNFTASSSPYELIANPYACAIDFDKIWNNSATSNIERKFWTIDPDLGNVGAYVSLAYIGNAYVPSVSTSQTQYIQSGQAFFVRAISLGIPSTIEIQEDDKETSAPQPMFRLNAGGNELFRMKLYRCSATDSILLDGTVVVGNNNSSNTINDEDAAKLSNFNENLFIVRGGSNLSIEARTLLDDGDTVRLGMSNMQQTTYLIEFEPNNMNVPGISAMLTDKFTNVSTPISLNGITRYAFSVTNSPASTGSDRFFVHFSNANPLAVKFLSFNAMATLGHVNLYWNISEEKGTVWYEAERSADGINFEPVSRILAKGEAQYIARDSLPFKEVSYYRVKAVSRKGEVVYSSVARVNMKSGTTELRLYPNPVATGKVVLYVDALPTGSYKLAIYDVTGKTLMTRSFQTKEENFHLDCDVSNFSPGVYLFQLLNKKNELIAEQKLLRH